jgi:uncharacterized membrane protein
VKRALIAKILAILFTLALASTAVAATSRAEIENGGGFGGGLSGAGTGNY